MTPVRAPVNRVLALASLAGVLLAGGCSLDIVRVKGTKPIEPAKFAALEVKKTTKDEVLAQLGPPDKLEFKLPDDYHWYWYYYYADTVNVGVRFQFPPPPFSAILGYRHNFLRLEEEAEDQNSLTLVFDQQDVLEDKSLRLPEAHAARSDADRRWRIHITPRLEHSVALLGDAGIRSYSKLFHDGPRVGLDLGFQPVPVLAILVSGSYEEHRGTTFPSHERPPGPGDSLDEFKFSDLALYELELGFKLGAPLSLLWTFTDFEHVKKVLFEDDLATARGWRIFIRGTAGATFNSSVRVRIDGAPAGDYYDRGIGLSGGAGAGLEYVWSWGGIHASAGYQTTEGLNAGDSPVADDGGAFGRFLLGGGVTISF